MRMELKTDLTSPLYSPEKVFRTFKDNVQAPPQERQEFPVTGVVSGVVVLFVLVACVAGLIIWKKRLINLPYKRKPRPKGETEDPELDVITSYEEVDSGTQQCDYEIVNVKNSAKNDQKTASRVTYAVRPSNPPIRVSEFSHYVEEMMKSGEFAKQFSEFPRDQQYSWEVADNPDLKDKNRYKNIIAYDHNRVILDVIESIPGSHYINASFIDGYCKPNTYIATQGPCNATIEDFWRMIWQYNVDSIVMLTNLIEMGKVKCSEYWDEEKQQKYGEINVTVVKSEKFSAYTIKTIQLENYRNEVRIVKHFHFTSWPDKSVPKIPCGLLSLRRRLRTHHANNGTPVVVHCSAGIGRTGTFIVIDAMLEQAEDEGTVDVYNFLHMAREKRVNMVQTPEQYQFIHTAIQEHILCGVTEISLNDLRYHYRKLVQTNKYGITGFQEQFQKLDLITTPLFKEKCSSAYQKYNMAKNRSQDIVPVDYARPMLRYSEGREGEDYINAVFIDGFQTKDGFIVTEHPLKETIKDFWRMVYEQECTSIVMLNNIQEDPQSFPMYWPNQGACRYGPLVVELISEKLSKGFFQRKLKIYRMESPESNRELCQFAATAWPAHGIPEDHCHFLEMLEALQKFQQHAGGGKVIIQCSDGSGRSGTFVAAHNVLERVKAEQTVDVFQCIRTMRIVRPSLVETVEQYKFCFDIVLYYVDSLASYSNFSEA